MSASVQSAPLQTFRLRTPHWALPAFVASVALHFALAAWLGADRSSTTLGILLVWVLPIAVWIGGGIATGEMARRSGGKLLVDREHHQLIQRHPGLPEPAGTWEWSEIKAVRVRRRLASDLVEIDLGSMRLCACTQRCQGHGLVSELRESAPTVDAAAGSTAAAGA